MTIGETLRTAREAKGFSVQDVQTATHMTARQVTDIENDDFSSFAYPFYAKVFLRQFARAVGLDPAPLVARLAEESGSSGGDKTPSPVVPLETIDENDGGLKIVKPDIPDGGAVKRAAPPPEAPAKVAAPRPEKRVAASDPMVAAAAAAAAAAKPPVTELKPSDAPLPAKRAAFVRPGEVPPEPVSLRAPEEDVEARKVQPEFDFAPAVKKVVPESDSAAGEIVDPRAPAALPEFTAPSAPAFVFPFSSPPAQTAAFDEPDAAPAPVAPAPAPVAPAPAPADSFPSAPDGEPDLFSFPTASPGAKPPVSAAGEDRRTDSRGDAGEPARPGVCAKAAESLKSLSAAVSQVFKPRRRPRRDPFGAGEIFSDVPRRPMRFPMPSRPVAIASAVVVAVLAVGGAIVSLSGGGSETDTGKTPPPAPEAVETPAAPLADAPSTAPADAAPSTVDALPARPQPMFPPPRCFAR